METRWRRHAEPINVAGFQQLSTRTSCGVSHAHRDAQLTSTAGPHAVAWLRDEEAIKATQHLTTRPSACLSEAPTMTC